MKGFSAAQKKFVVENNTAGEALSQALEFIHEQLCLLKLDVKASSRAELMCEEVLVSLVEHGVFHDGSSIRVNISKFFGNVNIKLTVPGQEFAFTGGLGDVLAAEDDAESDDISPETAESIRNVLLRSFVQNLRYRHSGNYNMITVKAVRSSYSGLYMILIAMVSAVICGLLMKRLLPERVYMFVNGSIFETVKTIFMNGLQLCAVPVVFLSIASCLADTGSMSGIKRTGGKILGCFLTTQVISVLIAFGLMLVFRAGEGAGLSVPESINARAESVSVLNTLVNIIPLSIVRPFLDGNMLQIIALAVFFGVSVSMSGAKSITYALNEINAVFMKMMEILLKVVPLVVFCSIASIILTTGIRTLLSVLGITLTIAAGNVLLFVLYWLMAKFLARLNPAVMYRKSLPALITAASTCSSIAAFPDAMRCAKNMGIPSYVYSFTLPLGITISRNIAIIYIVAGVMFTANIYGKVLMFGDIAFLGISALVVVMGTANVPGGVAVVMSMILVEFGLPVDTVPIFMMIDIVNDMLDAATACMGPITTALVVSAREGILDTEKYAHP